MNITMAKLVLTLKASSHCHPKGHHLGQAFHHSCGERLLGNKTGQPHTVLWKMTGSCGSVLVHLIPGTGIISATVPRKLLLMAGTDDCHSSARVCNATFNNFAKATFDAISKLSDTTPQTSGKRLCSPCLLIKNSLTIL